MRATEFLNEVGVLSYNGDDAVSEPETVTITIPKELLNIGREEEREEICDTEEEQQEEAVKISANEPNDDNDELADIIRLSRGEHRTPASGENHTIAAPATNDVPEHPVFVSPLQQQLELQKQQGGKESPVINQIIDDSILGSTAGEQPEQSVYHDSPLQDNEWVGAGTGEVEELRNRTSTQGATKPWYKL